jgi:hypothetical protein
MDKKLYQAAIAEIKYCHQDYEELFVINNKDKSLKKTSDDETFYYVVGRAGGLVRGMMSMLFYLDNNGAKSYEIENCLEKMHKLEDLCKTGNRMNMMLRNEI